MNETEAEYLKYRIARAEESLKEAELLLCDNHENTAVNRLYYACFYAVSALLLTEGHHSSKHTGIRSLFFRTWIKEGRLSKEFGKTYQELFDSRQQSDYSDLLDFELEEVKAYAVRATELVQVVAGLVREKLSAL